MLIYKAHFPQAINEHIRISILQYFDPPHALKASTCVWVRVRAHAFEHEKLKFCQDSCVCVTKNDFQSRLVCIKANKTTGFHLNSFFENELNRGQVLDVVNRIFNLVQVFLFAEVENFAWPRDKDFWSCVCAFGKYKIMSFGAFESSEGGLEICRGPREGTTDVP